jgi:esterase
MDLFHRDLGGAGRPPLIILHGMLGSSRNWLTAGRDLAVQYHVRALDLRNHGQSPHADRMTYADMAVDVAAWLDRHEPGPVTLLGHSMGGKTGMLLACRQPARVKRLFVIDIAPKDYFWSAHRASFAAMNELNLGDLRSRAEAELRFEARVPDWGTRKFLATNLERTGDGAWKWLVNLPVLTGALPALESNPLVAGDHYEGPVRFITGGQSPYIAAEDHPVILTHFPQAAVVVVPSSGHSPHLETREEFVAAVLGG